MIYALLEMGASVNLGVATSEKLTTPLFVLFGKYGLIPALKHLLQYKPSIDVQDAFGVLVTLEMEALKIALDAGLDPVKRDNYKNTMLHYLVNSNEIEKVQLTLTYVPTNRIMELFTVPGQEGKSIIEIATSDEMREILKQTALKGGIMVKMTYVTKLS